MKEEEMKQLKAYKVGYDLGWYRAYESICVDLGEIADAMLQSAAFQEIQREIGDDKPIFLAKILRIISQVNEMRAESLPTLMVEREAITRLGEGLQKALADDATALDSTKSLAIGVKL